MIEEILLTTMQETLQTMGHVPYHSYPIIKRVGSFIPLFTVFLHPRWCRKSHQPHRCASAIDRSTFPAPGRSFPLVKKLWVSTLGVAVVVVVVVAVAG